MNGQKQVLNKLKSKKGSALLLAMFFSLICLILGMVILAAGDTANGRIVNAAKAEQSYYIVESLFREFEQETSYEYTPEGASNPLVRTMKLRLNTPDFEGDFNINNSEDVNGLFTHPDDEHRLTTLKPFVAMALYKAMTTGSYSQDLIFELGGQPNLEEQYTAFVHMTVQSTDYSIYLDVTDVKRGTADSGESIGVPNLHMIAIQCKQILPRAVGAGGQLTDAVFEYYPAKFVR